MDLRPQEPCLVGHLPAAVHDGNMEGALSRRDSAMPVRQCALLFGYVETERFRRRELTQRGAAIVDC